VLEEVVKEIENAEMRLEALSKPLDLSGRLREIGTLEANASEPDFWDDPAGAQVQMQRLNILKESLAPWQAVRKQIDDARTLAELAEMEEDPESYLPELKGELAAIISALDKVEVETLLSGKHDAAPALLEINAGAGGTDANDWASILQRMYLRWADRHGFKVEIQDEVEGDVVGLKSTTLRIEGKNAYGLLQGERGVHRLVRISPFNSGGTRETSFAGVDVVPETAESEAVEIPDKDIKREAIRSSGAGGQHVNKTSSKIRITHLPTGIVVAVQNERSQFQNETIAMNILKSKLLALARIEDKASINELRGERHDIAFGHQIRNYVFQPYTLVKDTRTGHDTGDIQRVMNGEFDDFIDNYLRWQQAQKAQEA
jgi:peptide chain release factor 2